MSICLKCFNGFQYRSIADVVLVSRQLLLTFNQRFRKPVKFDEMDGFRDTNNNNIMSTIICLGWRTRSNDDYYTHYG